MRYAPRIDTAGLALLAGGVIAYPTEGVYGLGCLPGEAGAIHRLLHIKHRSWRKGLALVAGNIAQLEQLVVFPRGAMADEIEASWPGPVTWVLPALSGTPSLLTGGRGTLAVRVTDHPMAKALCLRIGSALVSTSANRSRSAPLRTALSVRRALGAEVDYVLAGPLGGLGGPTPIRDGATGAYLRGG
jgi:L-threonylcarbamoyladenylate synthase